MKDNALWIIMVILGLVACWFIAPRAFVDGLREKIPFAFNTTPHPTPTLSAGGAGVEATRVAREQSAQMTAAAAQGEMQATMQAGVVEATRLAAEAEQAQRDQEDARRAAATVGAIQATGEHERVVAAATSAAEATKAQRAAVAATATRQVEQDNMTATVESRQATATREAVERIEKKKNQANIQQLGEKAIAFAVAGAIAAALAVAALLLLCQCLKHMKQWPDTLHALLVIWDKWRKKECKTKVTPS